MRLWLICLLFLGLTVLCIEGQKCGEQKKCPQSKGKCQSKKLKCDGKVLKGKKFCKKKTCVCCVKSTTKPKPKCKLTCDNGGKCLIKGKKQTCKCTPQWKGKSCQIPVCKEKCINNGWCKAPDVCGCPKKWTGPTCSIPVCDPVCANGGTCSAPGTCACAEGWTGTSCEIPICDPECKNDGKCTAPDVCTCEPPWGGPTCEDVDPGVCSKELVMEHGVTTTWESPGYDGTTHYPDGDYCCWLNVTIPDDYSMFMATMTMSNPARIYETPQCAGDRIYYYPSSGNPSQLCGNLAGQQWTETAVQTMPHKFSFEWCSVPTDGGTDVGFSMTIEGTNFG